MRRYEGMNDQPGGSKELEAEAARAPLEVMELKLPTFQEAIRRELGTSKSVTISRLVTTEGALQAARELGVSLLEIRKHVQYWVLRLKCQEPEWFNKGNHGRKSLDIRQYAKRSQQLGLVRADCSFCGDAIEKDAERIFLSATFLHYDARDESDDGSDVRLTILADSHCCLKCAAKTEEFRIRNKSYISEDEARKRAEELTGFTTEMRASQEEDAKAEAAWDCLVKGRLLAGDKHEFNRRFPTARPSRGDVLERATTCSDLATRRSIGAAQNSKGDGGAQVSVSEVADDIFTTDSPDTLYSETIGTGSYVAGVNAQRGRVGQYLKDLRSRNKLMPDERRAATLWSEGKSEAEIAKTMGVKHPSTIHDRIAKVKRMAFAAR
jgi:hypothetical protein